jgi:hypothetical protein
MIDSPLTKRLLIAPIVFIIIVQFILFFGNMFEINISMCYIAIVMLSVPMFLYVLMG